jgi:hypothetical protein
MQKKGSVGGKAMVCTTSSSSKDCPKDRYRLRFLEQNPHKVGVRALLASCFLTDT